MITANARTNAIGHNISGIDSAMGGLTCKVDQFRIEVCGKSGGHFHPEDKAVDYGRGSYFLGDLLSHRDDIAIIAAHLYENGLNLHAKCIIKKVGKKGKKELLEVWTERERFMVVHKRVYGHKLLHRVRIAEPQRVAGE